MQQLSKVVFLESARIPYQEFKLDGNIHFIGTQGVGKSTVLRAILFFYTADSRRLGISKEQKPFAEYYFPYVNSYIVYEVHREERAFCVWLQRRQNRLIFRFIDGPYDKNAFIETVTGKDDANPPGHSIRSEEGIIKHYASTGVKIGKQLANKEFQDIIYGANRKMRHYSLLESSAYENIPRTISNIFMNSSLDASFIKQTIIHSLTDNPHVINLDTNRHHLETAQKDYADVRAFQNHVRKAENVVSAYKAIRQLEETMKTLAWRIGASSNFSRTEARRMESREKEMLQALQNKRQEKHSANENARKEIDQLNKKLGVVQENIKTANSKQREYQKQNIGELLKEEERKPQYLSERKQKAQTLKSLTRRHEDTELKYSYALQEVDNRLIGDKQDLLARKNEAREQYYSKKETQDKQMRAYMEQVEAEYRLTLDNLEKQIRETALDINDKENKHRHIREQSYLQEEKQQIQDAIHQTRQDRVLKQGNLEKLQEQAKKLKQDWQVEKDASENKHNTRIEEIAARIGSLQNDEALTRQKLETYANTLLAFLDKENPQWRHDIGRMATEDLLMRTDLQPRRGNGTDFYGIHLNLEQLTPTGLSKTALEKRLNAIQTEIQQKEKERQHEQQALEKERHRIRKKFRSKNRELHEAAKALEHELEQLAIQISHRENEQVRIQERAEELRDAAMKKVKDELSQLKQDKQELDEKIKSVQQELKARKEEVEKNHNKNIATLKKASEKEQQAAEKQIESLQAAAEKEKDALMQQREQALKDNGVDTNAIKTLENRIKDLDARLQWLEDNSKLLTYYRRDQEEYIGQLENFRQERKFLEEKIARRQDNLTGRLRSFDEEIARLQKEQEAFKNKKAHHREQVRIMDENFIKQQLYLDYKGYVENEDIYKEESVNNLLQQFFGHQNQKTQQQASLLERVSQFTGNFSEDNKLGFPAKVQTHQESLTFAGQLAEFMDNQKILDFEQEVNQKYAMVLDNIGKETDALLEHEDQVHAVIRRINQDFRQSNFVGVVRSIEMRLKDSDDPLVQILKAIQDFRRNNPHNYGQPNLFSTEDKGKNDQEAVQLLEELYKRMSRHKEQKIRLEDAFELEFRIRENENDTDWVNRLANVGSNGTDVLVKSMIYINLLNIFKKHETRKTDNSKLHCLIDEVGVLHDSNVKGLIDFASARNIHLINGSPNSHNEEDYKHIYEFMKDPETSNTRIVKLLSHYA